MRQRFWWIAIALVGASASCGDVGGGPARGFGSRQLLQTRDPTLRLWGRQGESSYVYSTGGVPSPGSKGADTLGTWSDYLEGVGAVYWSVSSIDGHVENLGTERPGLVIGKYRCVSVSMGVEGSTVTITDSESGMATILDKVHSGSYCPRDRDSILVFLRLDDSGRKTLWTGRYDQLQPAPIDLVVDGIVTGVLDADLRFVSLTVTAALPAEPDRLGVFEIDMATFARTENVPPILTQAAWASGAMSPMEQPVLESASLASIPHMVRKIGDHYSYPRLMSAGDTIIFVGPLSDGPARELALFSFTDTSHSQIGIANPSATNGFIYAHPTLMAWHEGSTVPGEGLLRFWDDRGQRLVTCPLLTSTFGQPIGIAAPDALRALFYTLVDPGNSANAGPLLLVSPDAASPCTPLAERVTHASFSPDGAALFWRAIPSSGDPELWAAAVDGRAPRLLGRGAIDRPRFVADTRIAFMLGEDLVWLDLRDDPVRLHYVAEKVFESGQPGLAWPWMIIGYQSSPGDGTGTLGLVNGETGAKRAISPWVSQYRYYWTPPYPNLPLRVIYQVRERNPSRQDGLWLAEITAQDLQP